MKKLLSYRRVLLFLGLPLGLLLSFLASLFPAVTEVVYSRAIYPVLNAVTGFLPSLLMFSVIEWCVILLPAAVVLLIILFVVRIKKKKSTLVSILATVLAMVGLLGILYPLLGGLNYSRQPFAVSAGISEKATDVTSLRTLCLTLAEKCNTEKGSTSSAPETDLAAVSVLAASALHEKYPFLPVAYRVPKTAVFSRGMSRINLMGLYFSPTGEATINGDIPEWSIPHTMCHELAHEAGFMREDEAGYIGYLACIKSESALFRYSGYLTAFVYSINALYETDYKAANDTMQKLSAAVRADLEENSAYWAQFEGPFSDFSDAVNDWNLKANGQRDGIKSYGGLVDLLLRDDGEE